MAVGSSCETIDKIDSKVRGTHLADPMRMEEHLQLSGNNEPGTGRQSSMKHRKTLNT